MKKAHRSRVFIAACLALTMSACNSDSADHEVADAMISNITGTVAYRERIALTPGYQLKVTLSDVSVADRAAPVLAETSRVLMDEQVPLAFDLQVESNLLLPRHLYSVRAVLINPEGQLAWTTDTANPIDIALQTQDLGTLRLVSAEAESKQTARGSMSLLGTSWQVEDVASGGVIDMSNITLNFDKNGRLTGSSGCNSYTGEFAVTGNKLEVGKLAGTMMACPPALMDLEQKFLGVLTQATGFSIDAEKSKITITAANGQTLTAVQVD